ncbi:unnamed protein product [Caenorhabditis brenneri]
MAPLPTTTPIPCIGDACEQWPLILVSALFFFLILVFGITFWYLLHGDREAFLLEVNRNANGKRQIDDDDYELSEVETSTNEEKY